MAIQWFPGHMHRARKQILETIANIDLVIEVLDARLPYSSENPIIPDLLKDRPCLKLLNKTDLADPELTQVWLDYFNSRENTRAIALTGLDKKQVKRITQYCHEMLPERRESKKSIRTMIVGIPNVGKSTLINTLAGRTVAKAGNLPALTRHPQQIKINDGIVLSDTPGILWPKIHNVKSGFRLAASGAVRDTALDYFEVAEFAGQMLIDLYPERLVERYKLKALPESGEEVIDAIGRKRGCLRSGGVVDMHKAAEILIHELRNGKMGKLTYETPDIMEAEEAALAEERARKEAEAEEKKAKK
ncbi:ribosome biogenesis GTPase YlqF [Bermanella marisrubri]|uniref:Ribosome biogenesis GTPase A n=1 Tax=Bermanella marisrubri TaxID=207949 RepID=Q1N5A6_9GAMM|nr:ribosome biogenesis GTPase YlqF [Bermanella marisrubri]EAT13159.1 putative GTPase YlqF [Oceanobacter sp. RED65] [Bermanella marisrubri]QIZ83933.1 ribosome biogenesis GTPase YlqF [Bermanella marisrubri]